MSLSSPWRHWLAQLGIGALTTGCGADPGTGPGPTTGTLRVAVSYPSEMPIARYGFPSVLVDGGNETATDASGSAVLITRPPGDVTVSLVGVPANCISASPVLVAVTVAAGATTEVTFALDCRQVNQLLVFSGTGLATASLALVDADGARFHQLFTPTAGIGAVAWAPDARLIAFSYKAFSNQQAAVWTVRPDGTGLKSLWADPDGGDPYAIAWSPDGGRLAITTGPPFFVRGATALYLVSADGTSHVRVRPLPGYPSSLSWARDGAKLAFGLRLIDSVGQSHVELHVVNSDGAGDVIVALLGGLQKLEWSPAGDRIAVFNGAGLWTLRPDGTDSVLVRNGSAFDFDWSPEGSRLALAALDGLHVINADGSGDMLVLPKGAESEPDIVRWSPAGNQLAFVRGIIADDSLTNQHFNTAVVDPSGSGLVTLLQDQNRELAAWRP